VETSFPQTNVAVVAAENPARRGGWLLIASLITFVAALALMLIVDAEYQRAIVAAADAAGTTIMTIPSEEQARVAADHASFAGYLLAIPLLVPFAIVLVAARTLHRAFDAPEATRLTQRATWLAAAMCAFWYFYVLLSVGLFFGPDRLPPLVAQIDVLGVPLVTAAAISGCASVAFLGLAARAANLAPRVGLAAAIVSGGLIVIGVVTVFASGFTMDLPPIAPFAPALILGIGVVRAARQP
jgi:hypothetical protein